ncbi:MAG: hypothetical protein ACI4D7_05855 [Lachnospiraceae bacterium]
MVIAMILLLFFCVWNTPFSVCAQQNNTFTDALEFYDQYGTGEIVFQDGNFYYGSRGKAGSDTGTRYGVEGQKFTLITENDQVYEIGVALASENHFGSCKRISYEKRGQYYYSLYRIRYDDLLERFQKKYPQTDFYGMMYNRQVTFQIDFYLAIVKNGSSSGYIVEKDDGSIEQNGTIYDNAEDIRHAANWSEDTKEAFDGYFGILMHIYQPSIWYLDFCKNADAAVGAMEPQQFIWNEAQKIRSNGFTCDITVSFCVNHPLDPSGKDDFSRTVPASFEGWSLYPSGSVRYQDGETVKNLTEENEKRIPLYAVWTEAELQFPVIEDKNYELIGWCEVPLPVQGPGGKTGYSEETKIFLPGETVKAKENCSWYGVWKKKSYRIRFMEPMDREMQNQYVYTDEEVSAIRRQIVLCGMAGKELNQELVQRGMICGKSQQ